MIQGLSEKFHQPIAVFTSKGPVKGIDLTKIVLKAILLLENSGVQVLAITSDGASTNHTMWHTLGIYAQSDEIRNSFTNLFDNYRQVFVFSDAPHLLKTVRNRLHTKKTLRISPTKPPIKWAIYEHLYETDSKSLTRICPRLTKNHFQLNSFSEMKVKFASQIFSKSVADGIRFFNTKSYPGFNECEETIHFTIFMNNLFDALNRKFPAEGIKKNSQDLEILLNVMCCSFLCDVLWY